MVTAEQGYLALGITVVLLIVGLLIYSKLSQKKIKKGLIQGQPTSKVISNTKQPEVVNNNVDDADETNEESEEGSGFKLSNIFGVFVGLIVLVTVGVQIIQTLGTSLNTSTNNATSAINQSMSGTIGSSLTTLLLVGAVFLILSLFSLVGGSSNSEEDDDEEQ